VSTTALSVAAERAAHALSAARLRVAVAESCTGGLLATALTDVPGSSAYFLGGIVAYHNDVKQHHLGISEAVLRMHGAVSAEVARGMAEAVRSQMNADLGVGITGVAGPADEGSKRAGLTFIALATRGGTQERRYQWTGDRRTNREASVEAALGLLVEATQYQS
jgi:PncC family amidohydrolase